MIKLSRELHYFHGLRNGRIMSTTMCITRLSAGVNVVPGMLVQFTIGNESCILDKKDIKILISELVDVI